MTYVSRHFGDTQEMYYLQAYLSTTVANKGTQKLQRLEYPMNLLIEGYTVTILFVVCPLNHDVILCMNWNKEYKKK